MGGRGEGVDKKRKGVELVEEECVQKEEVKEKEVPEWGSMCGEEEGGGVSGGRCEWREV